MQGHTLFEVTWPEVSLASEADAALANWGEDNVNKAAAAAANAACCLQPLERSQKSCSLFNPARHVAC